MYLEESFDFILDRVMKESGSRMYQQVMDQLTHKGATNVILDTFNTDLRDCKYVNIVFDYEGKQYRIEFSTTGKSVNLVVRKDDAVKWEPALKTQWDYGWKNEEISSSLSVVTMIEKLDKLLRKRLKQKNS